MLGEKLKLRQLLIDWLFRCWESSWSCGSFWLIDGLDAGWAAEAAAAGDRQRHGLLQALLRDELPEHRGPAPHGANLRLPSQ